VKNAAKAIEYYTKAFGAEELFRLDMPGGKIAHAEIRIGDSPVMLSDESPEAGCTAPQGGAYSVSMMLYVNDVDRVFAQAVKAGGTAKRPVQDEFWGDRRGVLVDPFGHVWSITTHKEDVPPEEIDRRMKAMFTGEKH
jgi:PhnB protein